MALYEEYMTTMDDSSRTGIVLLNRLYRALRYKTENPRFLWGFCTQGGLCLCLFKHRCLVRLENLYKLFQNILDTRENLLYLESYQQSLKTF